MFENIPLKLASLFLATLLWFVIAGEKTSEMGVQVPLELQNVPKELELTGDPVNSVAVRLRASPEIIHQLGPGEVSAQLDLAGAAEGERIIHLGSADVRVPYGVTVVKVAPASLTLNFERTLRKSVPVRPRVVGKPARGYEVGEVRSEPKEVRLEGPRSRIAGVESAFTEAVSVQGAESGVVAFVNIGLEDALLRVLDNPRARVTIEVRPVQERRTFEGVVVIPRGGKARMNPATVRITLSGPGPILKALQGSSIQAWVNASPAPGTASRLVGVDLPPGSSALHVDSTEPGEVLLLPGDAAPPSPPPGPSGS